MSDQTCPNCSVGFGPDDMFCENCGYDFITGSLPTESSAPSVVPSAPDADSGAPTPAASPTQQPASQPAAAQVPPSILDPDSGVTGPGAVESADVPRLRVTIGADADFFAEMVNDGEIEFPDPPPLDQELSLAGTELHIGRTSDTRAIHPDIDVSDLTGDQAVSSRHAVLRVANDGALTITDVGSTNGTFLDAVDSERLVAGMPVEVKPGVPIYVGAWTKLTVLD